MQQFILWLTYNRTLLLVMITMSCWIGVFAWYFRGPMQNWLRRGRPHNWSVDMVNKKAIVNGKEEVH